MSPEEGEEEPSEEDITVVEKSSDYVQRFVFDETVGATEDHVMIDFQVPDTTVKFDEVGNPVDISGPLQSSVRVFLTPSVTIDLALDLKETAETLEDASLEEIAQERSGSDNDNDNEDEGTTDE